MRQFTELVQRRAVHARKKRGKTLNRKPIAFLLARLCTVIVLCSGPLIAQKQPETPEMQTQVDVAKPRTQLGKRNTRQKPEDPLDADFYRTIIDNNLFRPLGWTPPTAQPKYQLLGTVISVDGTKKQAILQEITSARLYFLTVGDRLGDATLREILSKQVTLERAGKVFTLKQETLQFLSSSRTPEKPATGSSLADAQIETSRTAGIPMVKIKRASREERRRWIQKYYR